MRLRHLIMGLCAAVVISCGEQEFDKGALLARVNNESLYFSDVTGIFPASRMKYDDSMTLLRSHVRNWTRETILKQHAVKNMPDAGNKINRKADDYKRSLYIYEYERYYVRNNLDTVIPLTQMQSYYREHDRDFALKDYILKVFYVKLTEDAKDRQAIRNHLKSATAEGLLKVEELARASAENYFDGHDAWIYMNDLLREVPVKIEDKTQFLKNQSFIEVSQDGFVYYVLIFEYKFKDDLSPFQMEKENIRNRILQTRSAQLVERLRKDILKKAYREMEITDYVNK